MTMRTLFVLAAVAALGAFAAPGAAQTTTYHVPYFLPADASGRESFVRVLWRSCRTKPDLTIHGVDDAGNVHGPVTIPWQQGPGGCGKMTVFNSGDIERGNAGKGVHGMLGNGKGAWQLFIESTYPVRVVSYVRTSDGFLTAMHDTVPFNEDENAYVVSSFNPGRNTNQRSSLRLVNPNDTTVVVNIYALDDHKNPDGGPTLTLRARESLTVSAADLEAGRPEWAVPEPPDGEPDGRLGNEWFENVGKWQLWLRAQYPSDFRVRNVWQEIVVMNLLSTPTGHLTNLSTTPDLASDIGLPGEGPVRPQAGEYDIDLVFDAGVPAVVRASIERAARTWEGIVVGELPDLRRTIPDSFPNGLCKTSNQAAGSLYIDDHLVFVSMRNYGASSPTASADTCRYRPESHGGGRVLPYAGWITVNSRYQLDWEHTTARFDRTMVHELGHTLGFSRGVLERDYHTSPRGFIGPRALSEWVNRGAGAFYSLTGVRLPTDAIPLDGVHWDRRLQGEIMTGTICTGSKITPLTVAVLSDLGYTVDATKAEGYPRLGCGG